jgi:uroporphyrinogen-III synthase
VTNSKEKIERFVTAALPLQRKTILVTRPKDQADEFAQLVIAGGANVVFIPTIEIASPESWKTCDTEIDHIGTFDAFIFTSANAVQAFFGRLLLQGSDSAGKVLGKKDFYVVGTKTGEALVAEGIAPIFLPGVTNGRQLAEALLRLPLRGKRFLFPQGNLANEELTTLLRSNGVDIIEITVYDTIVPRDADPKSIREKFENDLIDIVSFFSPSSVKNLITLVPSELVSSRIIAVIGTSTEAAAREAGLPVHIIAPRPTSADLAEAIVRYHRQ